MLARTILIPFGIAVALSVAVPGVALSQTTAGTSLLSLQAEAKNGSADAQFKLGVAYLQGQRVQRDPALALQWFQAAAAQGHAWGQDYLGNMLYSGMGTSRDPNQAITWWRKAADQGLAAAQYHLGYAYEQGQGNPQDYVEAAKWYEKASGQDDARAHARLGALFIEGQGVTKDPRRAEQLWLRAAAKGYPLAYYYLGLFYEYGHGVRKDFEEAAKWYEKAAAHRIKDASTRLQSLRKIRDEGRTAKTEKDYLPPPGPIETYKGKTLIGSSYAKVNNAEFFSTVKQALDLTAKLPPQLRDDIRLLTTIIYDPPSPERKKKDIYTNIAGVYTIGPDFMKPAPIIVYKDMKYAKVLDFVEILAGNGRRAKKHREAMQVKKRMAELDTQGRGKDDAERKALDAKLAAFVDVVQKRDREGAQQDNCESLLIKYEVYKAFEVDSRWKDALAKRLSSLKCW